MAGILAGAMMGGGRALQNAAAQGQRTASDYFLQQQSAEIQALRDARLAEIRRGEIQFAEDVRRQAGIQAGQAAEKAAGAQVDDLSGTVRPQTESEQATSRAGAYRSAGMIGEAQREEQGERERQRFADERVERGARQDIAREELDIRREDQKLRGGALDLEATRTFGNLEHQSRMYDLAVKQYEEAKRTGDLDRQIKQFAVDNAKRVKELNAEFSKATPERQEQIRLEMDMLRGKDSDNYMAVPVSYDEFTGKPNGYALVNKRTGKPVDTTGGAQQVQGSGWDPDTKTVYFQGEAIGTAANVNQAREMVNARKAQAGGARGRPQAAPLDPLEEGDRNPIGYDQPPKEETPGEIRARHRREATKVPQRPYDERFPPGL